uniref:Forkhead-associated domain-containing protein 1-like n=1 Tax=Phallusia mammillata TaxID=59560 RepID=A0A6F9DDI2_9ASCI|nr:forkhead-associated domain-containing protein 1-like [Phallusia mammillata]
MSKATPSAVKMTSKEAWTSENVAQRALQEKDQKLLRMGDEINRLAIFEQESKRKDATIAQLREENSQLQDLLMSDQANSTAKVCQKLKIVDEEINSRRSDINSLHKQVDAIKCKFVEGNTLTSQLSDREKKIHELRHDLDKFKKDYGMAQGLVKSLQREQQSQEATLTKKNDEIASLKARVTKKDVQLSTISAKFARITEDKSKDDLIESIRKESKELRLKLQASDSRANDQVTLLQSYKQEISKLQSSVKNESQDKKKLKQELESLQLKFNEVQRSERVLHVDLEQSTCRLDRFRMRVIRAVYVCPGIESPDDDDKIDDSSIVTDIKKIAKQRSEFQDQGQGWKNEAHKNETKLEEIRNANKTCRQVLDEIIKRLDKNGHHTRLIKQEMQTLSSLPTDENLMWIRSTFTELLSSEFSWLSQLDECLTDAGFDVFLSEQNPGEHVTSLHMALKNEEQAHHQTKSNISQLEIKHEEELQNRVEKLLQENEEKLASEIERIRSEEQLKLNDSIEKIRAKEEEKRLQALFDEREKVTTANLSMEQLKKVQIMYKMISIQ